MKHQQPNLLFPNLLIRGATDTASFRSQGVAGRMAADRKTTDVGDRL